MNGLKTILLVEYNPNDVYRVANEVVVLHERGKPRAR